MKPPYPAKKPTLELRLKPDMDPNPLCSSVSDRHSTGTLYPTDP